MHPHSYARKLVPMVSEKLSLTTPHILRFYAKCFVFPYEEMQYELQHFFRTIERDSENTEELAHVDQILNIVNMYQGMELKELREEYVTLFSGNAQCPLLAHDFTAKFSISYDSEIFVELIIDSDIPVNPDEPVDSISNYLEYFSILIEDLIDMGEEESRSTFFLREHIIPWILPFCEVLFRTSQISFYREAAIGLSEYLSWLMD